MNDVDLGVRWLSMVLDGMLWGVGMFVVTI